MNEPDRATDYHDRGVQAVYSVLIEMGQVLGAWREKFVIVGGAVPWLLLGDAHPQHVGTMDIDLDLDPAALTDGEYASLIEALEKKGYERNCEGLKPFQLRRWVKLDEGDPIAVLVDLLMPRDARGDRNKKKHMKGLRVQRATGGEIALIEHVKQTLEGKMPDGRYNTVDLLVASIPALLVMKGYALVGRDKKKDAYDIYFAIRNYREGLEKLAAECRRLSSNPVALLGYQHIAGKFVKEDAFGPQTVRIFMENSDSLGDMTPEQVQTDAFMQVAEWLKKMDLV